MTLEELIKIADSGYADNAIIQAHEGKGVGDTLAEFIAIEIKETFDPDADNDTQINEAMRVMQTAAREIKAVISSLFSALCVEDMEGEKHEPAKDN
jgi:hypothetical protein